MRATKRLFVFLTLLWVPLTPATGESPSVELLTEAAGPLQVAISLGCGGRAGPLQVTVSPESPETEPPLFESFTLAATDSSPAEIVSQDLADQMCRVLRQQSAFAGGAPGSKQARVVIELEYSGQCEGESAERASYYTLAFDLLCTDVSNIHAPSGADPGPAGDGFTAELEGAKGFSPDGAGVAFQQDFGENARQLMRVSVGIREESVTVPAGDAVLPGQVPGATGRDLLPGLFSESFRIETELELIPVDVSYGFRLLPPTARVVPTLYLGAGYAFADVEVPSVEGGELGDLIRPDPDALGGRGEDSFTLHAGVALRFNLGRRNRGGKYVYLGARTRWYAQRDVEETDEEVFVGFGIPTCCGGR